MGVIVAVVNQKGGVGKTTVTLGLASAAQAAGERVLVVDADPQASATWALGVEPEAVEFGTAEAMASDRPGSARRGVVASSWGPGVDVLPATRALQDREAERDGRGAGRRLARALKGVHEEYALTLVDCSPALGQLTVNALGAARLVLLVVEPAALSLRGIAAVSDLIDHVWEGVNGELDIAGVVVNRVPAVSSEADRQHDALARMLGRRTIWEPVVPQRVVISQALADRWPIHAYGARAAVPVEVFDSLYKRLRSAARKAQRAAATA